MTGTALEELELAGVIETAADRFFGREGLAVPVLGHEVQRAGHIKLGHDGRLYRYVEGAYRPDGDRFARATSKALLGPRFKRRHLDEIAAWLRAELPSIPERPDPNLINVSNGLLDWRTGELRPHSPEVPSTVQLPVAWDPLAECPAVWTFLESVLPEDALPLVLELAGYSLYPRSPFHVAVLLLGSGANGKSTLLKLLTALLGRRNVSAVSLQALAENRFAAAELYGRLANVAGDLDARAVRRSDTFKTLTGGDLVTGERKHEHPFMFASFALNLFSANEPPISADQTDAWFRRWLILPFDRTFQGEDADPQLLKRLTTPAELSGLLCLAVAGLNSLLARGRFELPASVRKAGDAYRSRLDTVRTFVEEACEFDLDASIIRTELYGTYSTWCRRNGRHAVSSANFYDHLERNHPGRIVARKSHGQRVLAGLRLVEVER